MRNHIISPRSFPKRPRTPNLICIFILIKTPKKPRAVAPPLRVYKSTFNKNTLNAYGLITLPLRLTPLHFKKILVKLTVFSSPLGGERASDCNGSCTSGAVRGQKSLDNHRSRAKEKISKKIFSKKAIS